MFDFGPKVRLDRRDFLKIGGASAAMLGAPANLAAVNAHDAYRPSSTATDTVPAKFAPPSKYPTLAMLTRYSPQKLAFATAAGYEGVVVTTDDFFDPDKLSDSQIDEIQATSRETGARIISSNACLGLITYILMPQSGGWTKLTSFAALSSPTGLAAGFAGRSAVGCPASLSVFRPRNLPLW
jgi:TAT (twin-arginine translocation) pathway signal sequence